MKRASGFILLLGIAALMAGCKLAVIVVEGGEVQSTGSGTCVASAICIVDVNDPNFSETFTAIPDEGWYFEKWHSGDRFFCGGSTDKRCRLSFKGHEESEAVEEMVASSELFYLMPVFKQAPDMITVDGKQWYQPYFFTGLSWEDINAVCPAGECAGVLNGYDMNGWTWASVEDVNALFNYYIGSAELGPGPDHFIAETDSSWADAFYNDDGWLPTGRGIFPTSRGTWGVLRDLRKEGEGYEAVLSDSTPGTWFPDPGDWETPDPFDTVITTRGNPVEKRYDSIGAWFYRNP